MAFRVLKGVGDSSKGEWSNLGNSAYHVRRRLTDKEQESVGEALDMRGTPDAADRLRRAWFYLIAPQLRFMAMTEIK